MKKQAYSYLLNFLMFSNVLSAANVATQTVTFSIHPISEISISSAPPPFIACATKPGCNPYDIIDASTFYALTTNGRSEKLVANISAPMPEGTALYMMVMPPYGAISLGDIHLDTVNQSLVTGISQTAQSNLPITYTFSTTAAAGVLPCATRVITFTLLP